MPFNFGSFAGGLAGGLREGQELKLRAEESKLKAKMLEHQMKLQDYDLEEKQRKATEEGQQALELGKYVDMIGQGVAGQPPAPLMAGQEGPEPAPAFQVPKRPATQGELLGQAVKSIPAGNRYQLIEQSMKEPAKQKTQLNSDQIQSLLGVDKSKADIIASLPGEAQERTIDNIRQASAITATGERATQSQTAADRRQQAQFEQQSQQQQNVFGQQAQLQRNQFAQQSELERRREEVRNAPKPLSEKERRDLHAAEMGLKDVQRLIELHKSSYTGWLQGGLLRKGKEFTGNMSPEQTEFNAKMAKVVNQIRNKLFGAALTKYESEEAMKGLPDTGQSDVNVGTKLKILAEDFTSGIAALKEGRMAPSSSSSTATGTLKFNPNTGKIE